MIRVLVDRIESLEAQMQELQTQPTLTPMPVNSVSLDLDSCKVPAALAPSCRLQDVVIQQFFDGSGI